MIGFAGLILFTWFYSIFSPDFVTSGGFLDRLAPAALLGAVWLGIWVLKELLTDIGWRAAGHAHGCPATRGAGERAGSFAGGGAADPSTPRRSPSGLVGGYRVREGHGRRKLVSGTAGQGGILQGHH